MRKIGLEQRDPACESDQAAYVTVKVEGIDPVQVLKGAVVVLGGVFLDRCRLVHGTRIIQP